MEQVTGRIFDIQKYSIHDGPGIRTIVFLKGCALRCRWCCNPESQEFGIQKMKFADSEKIVGRDVTVDEVMEEIRKDAPYYRRSGGGITLSGGESLLQPDFAVALLAACHEEGFNTAIETTGIAPFDVISRYLPHLDYIMMDIKHTNEEKHKEFTGQPNRRILENARKNAVSVKNSTKIRSDLSDRRIKQKKDSPEDCLPGCPFSHFGTIVYGKFTKWNDFFVKNTVQMCFFMV